MAESPSVGAYYRFCQMSDDTLLYTVSVEIVDERSASLSLRIQKDIINPALLPENRIETDYMDVSCSFQFGIDGRSLVVDSSSSEGVRDLLQRVPLLPSPIRLEYTLGETPTLEITIAGSQHILKLMEKNSELSNTVDSSSDEEEEN